MCYRQETLQRGSVFEKLRGLYIKRGSKLSNRARVWLYLITLYSYYSRNSNA